MVVEGHPRQFKTRCLGEERVCKARVHNAGKMTPGKPRSLKVRVRAMRGQTQIWTI